MAFNDTVSVAEVLRRFKQLFVYIRQVYPRTPFVYVSMKPSPSRRKLWPMFMEANVAIRQYLAQHKRTSFVDVYHAMLDAAGRPFPHIFIKDSLHMNAAGYQIWQKKLKPYIK